MGYGDKFWSTFYFLLKKLSQFPLSHSEHQLFQENLYASRLVHSLCFFRSKQDRGRMSSAVVWLLTQRTLWPYTLMNSCRQIDWPLKFNVLRLVEISFFVVPSTVIMPKTAIYQHLTLFSLTRKPGLGQPPKETKKLFFFFPTLCFLLEVLPRLWPWLFQVTVEIPVLQHILEDDINISISRLVVFFSLSFFAARPPRPAWRERESSTRLLAPARRHERKKIIICKHEGKFVPGKKCIAERFVWVCALCGL